MKLSQFPLPSNLSSVGYCETSRRKILPLFCVQSVLRYATGLWLSISFACIMSSCANGGGGYREYLSNVHFQSANFSNNVITGQVGQFLSARIDYQIGFATAPSGGGTMTIVDSYVTDPEYQVFGDNLPPGLSWDSTTGTISGTPTQGGKWSLQPAVRDRIRGDNVYRSNGAWWTDYTAFQGETWTEAQTPTTFDISQ